jgi:hypothetical protein
MIKGILFYIALLMLGFNQTANAQTYTQMVDFADKKVQEGDYYYAIIYYKKAMEIDSNSVEINWKIAEAQRHYKNYVLAEYYYQKVYNKEQAKIYPKSIFWLATMQHYNGKYNASFKSWKLAKKVFKRQRKSYEYKKSLAEFKSTLWAKKAINDTTKFIVKPIDKIINSSDTELAPFIHNEELYFTSLKADSIKVTEEVIADEYSLQIYHSKIKDSTYSKPKKLKDVYQKGYHSANGCFSPDGKRFYFSRCDENFKCKIFVGKVNGNKILDIDSLGTIINQEGVTTTMPNVALIDGKEILFFVSDREKTIGGLDIWWSEIKNGNQYSKPRNLGRKINSLDDDITPFYHPTEKKLYFSSPWHPGFGGQDIFCVDKIDGMISFLNPVNVGLPINSSQNDTYYFYDIKTEVAYFSSNRIGSNSIKTPTCCNDIFIAYLPKESQGSTHPFASLYDLNKKLPVTLYFHNDEPNPRTRDTITNLTYMQSYEDYIDLIPKYKREYSKGLIGENAEEAKEDISDFFIEYVEQGVIDLNEFTRLLLIELEKGYDIQVTVKGFASPLAKTDYNVNLTKRRINSLINYLYVYGNGEFKPYLDRTASNGGKLTFVQIPFGEYTANQLISDNPNDTKHSVYSRKAALERKIEIQSVSLVSKDSSYAEMSFDSEVYDFGKSTQGDVLTHTFNLTNTGTDTLIISNIETECGCTTIKLDKTMLLPNESTTINILLDTKQIPKGIRAKKVIIYSNIKEKKRIITLTTEIF